MDNTMLACGNRFGAVEWSECNSSPTQRKWSFGWNEVQAVLLRPAVNENSRSITPPQRSQLKLQRSWKIFLQKCLVIGLQFFRIRRCWCFGIEIIRIK